MKEEYNIDFSSFIKIMKSRGYSKIDISTHLTRFKSKFTKDSDIVIVNWEMGGYIKSVDSEGLVFTAEEFIEALSEIT